MLRQATKFAPLSDTEFQLAYDAGFRNAEFWLSRDLIQDWKVVAERAARFPLNYALHFPNRGDFSRAELEQVASLYRALNASALVIHQPMFDRFGQQLHEVEPAMRVAIENHNLPTDGDLERWAEESPWLTLDVEHLWIYTAGDDTLEQLLQYVDLLFTNYGSKLAHVHLPGYQPGYEIHRPQYCSRTMVMETFSRLANIGFDGLVVSEVIERYQNLPELTMDVLLYQQWETIYRNARISHEPELATTS